MERTSSLVIVLISNILVQGTVIDPQAPDASSTVHYHCLYGKEPIQIKDPYNPSERQHPKFISMDWYKMPTDGAEVTLVIVGRNAKNVRDPTVSIFEFWGLQINNIDLNADGNYTAKLLNLRGNREITLTIVVVVPPVLKNKRLVLTRSKNLDHSATLSCGPILSLGDPAVAILFKDGSGHVVHTVTNLTSGYAEVTETGPSSAVACEVDSSVGARCINNRSNWRATLGHSEAAQPMPCLYTGLLVLMAAVVVVYG